MRILSIVLVCALCFAFAVPALAAVDDYTLTQQTYDASGNLYQVYNDSADGDNYVYINGVMQKAIGLIFIDGYYYYIRTSGKLATNTAYYATTTNGLLPQREYTYDSYGRMINPPYYPDDWESQWFDSDPTVTVPTDPPVTDPPVTEPPVTVPPATDPVPGLDLSVDPNSIMSMFGVSVAACSSWFVSLMDGTGFGGIFLGMVFLMLSFKFVLQPIFGFSGSDSVKKKKEDS